MCGECLRGLSDVVVIAGEGRSRIFLVQGERGVSSSSSSAPLPASKTLPGSLWDAGDEGRKKWVLKASAGGLRCEAPSPGRL